MVEPAGAGPSGTDQLDVALRLLHDGIPISLLLDLAAPVHSDDLYEVEAGEADWLPAGAA
jgi:hypothetical protein